VRALLLVAGLALAAPADKPPEASASWETLDEFLQDFEGLRRRAGSLESELLSLHESYADRYNDAELISKLAELRERLGQTSADIPLLKGSFRRTLDVVSHKAVTRAAPAALRKGGLAGVGKAAMKVVGYEAQLRAMRELDDDIGTFLEKDERSYALIKGEARARTMKRLAAAALILLGLAAWRFFRRLRR